MISRMCPSPLSSPRRGIALLVTILLLSFLVLIMVALSSIVRVETKIATNQDTLAQARQNALTGLNIALGKLQETAGPDQRVTARADLFENSFGAQQYQMNLTGVWNTTNAGAAPVLITWLVNGNEDLQGDDPHITPDANPQGGGPPLVSDARTLIFDTREDALGEDHRSNEPLHNDRLPSAFTINPSTLPSGSAAPNFRFGDGHVYLVANGSVDVSKDRLNGALLGESYKHAVDERVIVRKTPLIVDGSKLPGRAAGTDVTIGHFAYWVGDSGIKASLAAANRVSEISYSGASGTDYAGGSSANDQEYMNRQWLHSLQLQGSRLDLAFRADPITNGAGAFFDDIFSFPPNAVPGFLRDANGNPISQKDRTVFYGMLAHPNARDIYTKLFTAEQLGDILSRTYDKPLLTGPTQFANADLNDFRAVIKSRLKQIYHDVTPRNFSVLTNMLNGGLRVDTSQLNLPSVQAELNVNDLPGIKRFANDVWRPGTGASVEFANNTAGLLRRRLNMTPAEPPANATDSAYPISPIVSEVSLVSALAPVGSGVTVTISGRIELWNPYNATLSVPPNLSVSVSVKDDTGASATKTRIRDQKSSITPLVYSPEFTLGTISGTLGNVNPMSPGEIRNVTLTFATSVFNGVDDVSSPIVYAPSASAPNPLIVTEYGKSIVTAELMQGATVLSRFQAVEFDGVIPSVPSKANVTYQFRLLDWAQATPATAWTQFDPRGPVILNNSVLKRGLNATDLFGSNTDLYHQGQNVVLFDVPRQDVVSVASLRHVAFPAQRLYAVGTATSAKNSLFEQIYFSGVPQSTTVNGWSPLTGAPLANTSTVVFDPTPSASSSETQLWNGSGGNLSGLLSEKASQYLLVRDTLNVNSTSEIAWRTFLGGALPTLADSSTTPSAYPPGEFQTEPTNKREDYTWRVGFPVGTRPWGQEIHDVWANWRFFDGAGVETTPVRNAFFRFPHTATEVDYLNLKANLSGAVGSSDADVAPRTLGPRELAAFKVGIRELTRSQAEELAWWVVYFIKNPARNASAPAGNRPFRSITQFIDENILQEAIDKVGTGAPAGYAFPAEWTNQPKINAVSDPLGASINTLNLPIKSPSYLTQGDILELIGHRLFARSDTFTIRVYGDVNDPDYDSDGDGNVEPKITSRVWLEATVQRTPIKHPTADEPDDNMTPTNTGGSEVGNFGRQFRILNIRWLRPDEV